MSKLLLNDIVHHRGEDGKLLPLEVELEALRKYETIKDEKGKPVKDEKGKLKKKLVEKGPTVKITPMSRGELRALMIGAKKAKKEGSVLESTEDQDGEIIKKHLIDPKVPDEQIKDLKPEYSGAITNAITAISLDVSQKEMQAAGIAGMKKLAEELEQGIKKK